MNFRKVWSFIAAAFAGMFGAKGKGYNAPVLPTGDKNSQRLQYGIKVKDWLSKEQAEKHRAALLLARGHWLWCIHGDKSGKLVIALNRQNAQRKFEKMGLAGHALWMDPRRCMDVYSTVSPGYHFLKSGYRNTTDFLDHMELHHGRAPRTVMNIVSDDVVNTVPGTPSILRIEN